MMKKNEQIKKDAANRDESNRGLEPEIEATEALLSCFERNDVNALVILENQDNVSIMANGISRAAILHFLWDVLLKHPEMFMLTIEKLKSIVGNEVDGQVMCRTMH